MEGAPGNGQEEGWYTDRYGLHEARWMSKGKPTRLVRDYGVESYDDPPNETPRLKPTPIPVYGGVRGNVDMLRADDTYLVAQDGFGVRHYIREPGGQLPQLSGYERQIVVRSVRGFVRGLVDWLQTHIFHARSTKKQSKARLPNP